MADRPRDGGPQEGTPEYNWLYGKKGDAPPPDATRAVPQQPRGQAGNQPGNQAGNQAGNQNPDQTQVMPAAAAAERGRSVSPSGGARPTPPPVSPPPGSSARTKRGFRAPRPRLRWLFIILLLWIVFLVAIPLWAWSKVDKVEAFPSGDRPSEQPGTTYLMVGSDSRGDLSAEERKELGTGNASGQRTDTIMLLHTGSGPNLLMSIPRDSLVEIPGHGTAKINAAFALGGPKLLVRTIESTTGIRVDHYVEIGFGGFVDLVDAVGGVEICPKTDMKDKLANLDVKKGCQEADGPTALAYARSRHTYTENGDIDRAKAQREVVAAIGHKATSPWSVINPVRYYRLNMAAPEALAVSDGTSPVAMVRWALAMTRVDGENGLTCGVPIADLSVRWDPERSKQMFAAIQEDDTESVEKICTPTGFPKGAR